MNENQYRQGKTAEQLGSRVRRAARRTVETLSEALLYARYRLSGKTYADYYAARMDRVVAQNPGWGLNLNKQFQLDYLRAHGLERTSALLDYGCGALAAGLRFIDYLDAGCYTGVDISARVLEEGHRRIRAAQLTQKAPRLLRLTSPDLSFLPSGAYDFIWAQSVFTHMPPEDITTLLPQLRRCLKPQGAFYATFALSEDGIRQRRFKDWYYDFAFFGSTAMSSGLKATLMEDWSHPDDPDGKDRLVRFITG